MTASRVTAKKSYCWVWHRRDVSRAGCLEPVRSGWPINWTMSWSRVKTSIGYGSWQISKEVGTRQRKWRIFVRHD